MITIDCTRNNGGPDHKFETQRVSTSSAFISLVRYELGYGTCVLKLQDTVIMVETRVLAAKDRVVFNGSKAEMLPLVAATATFILLSEKDANIKFIDAAYIILQKMEKSFCQQGKEVKEGIRAGFAVWFGPFLISTPKAKLAACVACNFDQEKILEIFKLNDNDFYALCVMHLDASVAQSVEQLPCK